MNAALSAAITEFCVLLREHYGFSTGRAQAHDAIRAAQALGIEDRTRLKTMMRAICASRPSEVAVFDRVFEDRRQ